MNNECVEFFARFFGEAIKNKDITTTKQVLRILNIFTSWNEYSGKIIFKNVPVDLTNQFSLFLEKQLLVLISSGQYENGFATATTVNSIIDSYMIWARGELTTDMLKAYYEELPDKVKDDSLYWIECGSGKFPILKIEKEPYFNDYMANFKEIKSFFNISDSDIQKINNVCINKYKINLLEDN